MDEFDIKDIGFDATGPKIRTYLFKNKSNFLSDIFNHCNEVLHLNTKGTEVPIIIYDAICENYFVWLI